MGVSIQPERDYGSRVGVAKSCCPFQRFSLNDSSTTEAMVEKNNLDNTPFPLNLPLQGDVNPLGKLMEQYHRLAQSESKNVQERVESVKPDKTPFTTADGTCAPYPPYWPTAGTNWWEANVANWQALGYNATGDNYAPYLTSSLNILQAAGVPTAAATSSTLNQRLPRISPNSLSSGGGKYTRGNCECPNCMETERIGLNNMPAKKRGIHNCHIRGCGKLYNKSSHLKAHLRWHSAERSQKPRRSGDVV